MTSLSGRIGQLEQSARALVAIKMANVALTMVWGFALTFVFVRVLPLGEFRAFLLLVAFANFTVSAEFGLTNIAYARLRRWWLGAKDGDAFDSGEAVVLLWILGALILTGLAVLAAVLALGVIRTHMPALFLTFFLVACMNVPALLAKRILAAMDCNLIWEATDFARRSVSLSLLGATLAGLAIETSVLLQLAVSIAALIFALGLAAHKLGMAKRGWFSPAGGMALVRAFYLKDLGLSAALTLSEIAAYNSPYFTIALVTHDVRPMLLFDFAFKMSRAFSLAMRALVEAALPRMTAAFYEHRVERLRQLIVRALAAGMAGALLGVAGLVSLGGFAVHVLFDGKASIGMVQAALIGVMVAALAVICVSVYLQGALGRFGRLLRQSLPFLAGSLACAPLAAWLPGDYATGFLGLYALVFVGTAALHGASLRQLMREARA